MDAVLDDVELAFVYWKTSRDGIDVGPEIEQLPYVLEHALDGAELATMPALAGLFQHSVVIDGVWTFPQAGRDVYMKVVAVAKMGTFVTQEAPGQRINSRHFLKTETSIRKTCLPGTSISRWWPSLRCSDLPLHG